MNEKTTLLYDFIEGKASYSIIIRIIILLKVEQLMVLTNIL